MVIRRLPIFMSFVFKDYNLLKVILTNLHILSGAAEVFKPCYLRNDSPLKAVTMETNECIIFVLM